VVITGMGALTALGAGVAPSWEAVLEGRSGVRQIRQFPSDDFPVRIGSEVDLDDVAIDELEPELRPFVTRSVRLGAWAVREAWEDAGLTEADVDPWRTGIMVGASNFPVIEDDYSWPTEALQGDDYRDQYLAICKALPELLDQRQIGMVSILLASPYPVQGPCFTVQSACASATQAIGEALHSIRQGKTDVVLAGGADSMLSAVCVTGFTLLSAASTFQGDPTRACRPFDLYRDGLVLGEGSGIVVLEELDHARRRGAHIYAEVLGYGSSLDGYRFTDSHPEAPGPISCMRAALDDARVAPEDVGHINAHGTATPQNDRTETYAIRQVFGPHADRVAVTSTKSQLGHLLCAAGGIEAVLTVLALRDGMVPATINLEHHDPDCDLDIVTGAPRRIDTDVALSNSFGFGGQNGALVFGRWAEADVVPGTRHGAAATDEAGR
jgi:3-oxoacyl-[acyl-carrier-protein] synthase II